MNTVIKREALIVRIAIENSGWGYERSVAALANLGYHTSDQTVGNVYVCVARGSYLKRLMRASVYCHRRVVRRLPPGGTVKFAWYNPIPPGVRPIYATVAATAPTVMLLLALTGDKPSGEAAPVVNLPAAFTGPPPVK